MKIMQIDKLIKNNLKVVRHKLNNYLYTKVDTN